MDAELTQSEQWLRFMAWMEDNWRRVASIASVVIVIGIVVAFLMWHGTEKQRSASEALSLLMVSPEPPGGEAFLDFARSHKGTEAGARALLFAARAFFTDGKYPEAQAQFEQFLTAQPAGPLTSTARFGIAACKEAQGQTEAAIRDYNSIVQNPASGNVIPQARFALGHLYAENGQPDQARTQYEELARATGTALAAEARARLAELPPSKENPQAELPTSRQSQPVEIPTLKIPSGPATNQP